MINQPLLFDEFYYPVLPRRLSATLNLSKWSSTPLWDKFENVSFVIHILLTVRNMFPIFGLLFVHIFILFSKFFIFVEM